jgi:Predicted acyltransferase
MSIRAEEPPVREWRRDGYVLSNDPARVDVETVHRFLSEQSYWAKGIPREVVERSIAGSLVFGIYEEATGEQVGFARVITDQATFAYLADVFVLQTARGKGLSTWMVGLILQQPQMQGLRRTLLATADAHTLYSRFGFRPLEKPERWMERHVPDVYERLSPRS